jgi:hypothetical protein
MQTVDDLEVSYDHFEIRSPRQAGLLDKLRSRQLILIAAIVAVAFCARVYQLDAAGLSEDEVNKVFAIRSYQQGDFTANAEHPMLMKMLCYASIGASEIWNESIGSQLGLVISEEAALRLPNATFGALTVAPIFLLATALLGFRAGLAASLLWALGLNAIWFNRIAKEDTLLVFFMLTAFYLYYRAKQLPASDVSGKERLYLLSGAAFGLMLASKYFPHYYGIFVLFFWIASHDDRDNVALTRRMKARHFGAILVTFAAFNFALFAPRTWRYLLDYASGDLLTHHGYLVLGKLHTNEIKDTPGGNTWLFYWLYLLLKLPIPVLVAFAAGAVEIFRHRGAHPWSRGYLFLRVMLIFWLLPMMFIGSKFMRYTLPLMPIIYMTAAVGTVAIWQLLSSGIKRFSGGRSFGWDFRFAPAAAATIVAALFVVAPSVITVKSLPYPSIYLNAFGGDRVGYLFPHDEFYDLGARESILYIAGHARPGAVVASEVPGVFMYYLERFGRTDIQSEVLSHPRFDLKTARPDYVLLQRGRLYFENRDTFLLIENNYPLAQSSTYKGAAASEVYQTGTSAMTVRK